MHSYSVQSNGPVDQRHPVVIVGAGLAGLSCARVLHQASIPFVVLETADRVGGRVATDCVAGFQLDRGFQVLLTAYPEASSVLDYAALKLRPFYPGALIQVGSRRYRFADPWQKPIGGLLGMLAPVARLSDAWRLARLRRDALRDSSRDIDGRSESTRDYLEASGLSPRVVQRFFRPFFGGVFLESELETPSSFFRFVFAMFARGPAALPADGMGALPRQLAEQLPPGSVRLNAQVEQVESEGVRLVSGEQIEGRVVVVATDADRACALTDSVSPPKWNAATTLYYAAPHSPIGQNILVLNGGETGLVNHVCVPSDVANSYAPNGQSLISISIVGVPQMDDPALSGSVIEEMRGWFGADVDDWRLLRIYRIKQALPRLQNRTNADPVRRAGVIVCGDHAQDPSINGALLSGRKAAELILYHTR